MTTEEFKSFIREFRMLMQKYNIRVKADSEEIEFGITGKPVFNGEGRYWVEKSSGILFLEILTPEEANKEEEEGKLIIGRS